MGSLFHNFERGNLAALPESKDCAVQKKTSLFKFSQAARKTLVPFLHILWVQTSNLFLLQWAKFKCCSFMRSKPKLTYVPCPAWADLSYRIFGSFNHRATNAYWKNGGRSRGGPVNGFSASWWESHSVHSKFTGHTGHKYWHRHFDKIIIVYIYGPLWYYTISLHTFHM